MTYFTPNIDSKPQWWTPAMYLLLFILTAGSFYILDLQALWMGDDLGYMFTDSVLHKGDGVRLTSPDQILSTQAMHYLTCNGRFIVHALTQLFVGLLGKEIFCACNALMFGLLVILTCRLALPHKQFGLGSGFVIALLLWFCIPRPGVTMLSLAAYSINYLWTGVATLLFLLLWKAVEEHRAKGTLYLLICVYAVIAGSLQESYSIPISAALILWWVVAGKHATSKEIAVIICYIAGTLVLICSPGNYQHLVAAGGVAPQALYAKLLALGKELICSPLTLLAVILIIWWIVKPIRCGQFCGRNMTLLAATLAALILACISFTAVRQLFAPSLFSAILIARIFIGERIAADLNRPLPLICSALIYTLIIIGAHNIRKYPLEISRSLLHQAVAGNRALYIPQNERPLHPTLAFLLERYNDDPVNGEDLRIVYDKFTKQALSRLYSPNNNPKHITTIIPVSQTQLEETAAKTVEKNGVITPVSLTKNHDCLRVYNPDNSAVRLRATNRKKFSYERIYSSPYLYYVIPAGTGTVTTAKPPKPKAVQAPKSEAKIIATPEAPVHHPANPTAPTAK